MPVQHLEMCIPGTELRPQLPHAEVTLTHVAMMKEHDPALAHLGKPALEILLHRVVRVESIDMQQVDGAIGEMRECIGERTTDEARKVTVPRIVMGPQVTQHRIAVESGVLV